MGHAVFSLGAYSNGGKGHYLLPRPAIPNMQEFPDLEIIGTNYPRTALPQQLFDWADVIITMHMPQFISGNWDKMKNKKVIFRSIGQNTLQVENEIRPFHYQGMKIIRMSEQEKNITGYVESEAVIPFYKDPGEWHDYTGHEKRVIAFVQSLKGRRLFCYYDYVMQLMAGFPSLVYGTGNEDLYGLNGGYLPYELQKGALRDNRCYISCGTWPSPYVLNTMEAMMTGMPIVFIGQKLAEEIVPASDRINFYEPPNWIKHGENGFIGDSINELRDCISQLLEDHYLATQISKEARKTAIKLWSKESAKKQWEEFFSKL